MLHTAFSSGVHAMAAARPAHAKLVRGIVKTIADLQGGERVRYRGIVIDVLRVEATIPQFTREPLRVIYGQALDAPPTHVAWPVGDIVEIIERAA